MSENLVEVKHLQQYFPAGGVGKNKQYVQAVDDVSFAIRKGETLGLAGESGCGSLKNLLLFRGPNVKKGFRYTRPRWLADIVPTLCYMPGGPIPEDAEGAPIYQIMEDPNLVK